MKEKMPSSSEAKDRKKKKKKVSVSPTAGDSSDVPMAEGVSGIEQGDHYSPSTISMSPPPSLLPPFLPVCPLDSILPLEGQPSVNPSAFFDDVSAASFLVCNHLDPKFKDVLDPCSTDVCSGFARFSASRKKRSLSSYDRMRGIKETSHNNMKSLSTTSAPQTSLFVESSPLVSSHLSGSSCNSGSNCSTPCFCSSCCAPAAATTGINTSDHSDSAQIRSRTDAVIRLNVGGHLFCTSLSTLTRIPSMLASMFSGKYLDNKDSQGHYFIDRDGIHFRYILNYLRDGELVLPEEDLHLRMGLLKEAHFYQIPGLIESLSQVPLYSCTEYITIRYLPASTYDGWPIRIEGPLESHIICQLNGGQIPPEKETPEIRNMYGQASTGWKVRGIFLTKIFNIIASYGWRLQTSNGSGGGKARNFAEMYVFCRNRSLRRKFIFGPSGERRLSTSYFTYSRMFPPSAMDDEDLELVAATAAELGGLEVSTSGPSPVSHVDADHHHHHHHHSSAAVDITIPVPFG